ncbi:Gfo/Idh/MocA family oxidoreductase [Arenibacter sp. F26102]|uniref:Gfo/Idh/MocA family oxidoreductase n=1 Tax=Arenibacter sp. F26102 TaxID=2926416 RepID=UPI001FF6ACDE|nr:Gfo/Idh/MocA family oxidoreductase [Arenibacter sp. F26102]MCK0147367.1 Gfo/Idh/MocA family oxidoreductase [Arenibacter sp. F26102]
MVIKTINTGILSFGMSGTLFQAPFLNEHPGFQLTAVVERSKKSAHKSYPNIKSYDTVDQLIADKDIDLVVVNTPNPTHFEFALKALKAKKHVLVEKPFCVTSSEAKELFAEAKKVDRIILPYQNRRYDSDFLSVKRVLESGKLGSLVEVHMRYDRYRHHIGPKIAKETPVPGSGLLYDLGPHLLDATIALFGYPLEWSKHTGQFRPKTQVDDYAHIHLLYPKGVQVFITMSMLVVQPQASFVLNGTKGTFVKPRTDIQEQQLLAGMSPGDPLFGIEESDNFGVLTTIVENGEKQIEKIESAKSSYINLFEDVYKSLVDGIPYPITEKDIILQLEILEG